MIQEHRPELNLPAVCPECGWRGYLHEAKVELNSIVDCPTCGGPVEGTAWMPLTVNVHLSDGTTADARCWVSPDGEVSYDPLPVAIAEEYEVREMLTPYLVRKSRLRPGGFFHRLCSWWKRS